jgi:hypothetical protein
MIYKFNVGGMSLRQVLSALHLANRTWLVGIAALVIVVVVDKRMPMIS